MSELSTALSNKDGAAIAGAATPGGVIARTIDGIRSFIRSSPVGAISLAIWLIIILMAVFAPQIALRPIGANLLRRGAVVGALVGYGSPGA
ncbi:MAG: hypothetical protein R2867_41900 [Caldilineaceae bacterium]